MDDETAIYGPRGEVLSGHLRGQSTPGIPTTQGVMIDNQTGLDDGAVEYAIESYFQENAEALGVGRGRIDNFSAQTYSGDGSLLSRSKYTPPTNVIEEIELARELAERDDDVAPAMDLMMSAALGSGMENKHPDEQTRVLFNQVAKTLDLDAQLNELMREWLIAGQVTSVAWWSGAPFTFTPEGGDGRSRKEFRLTVPKLGVLPAERIRLIGSDMFGTAQLAYLPGESETKLKEWLDSFLSDSTPPATKNTMKKEDPISAALFLEAVKLSSDDQTMLGAEADTVYILNPKMVARTTRAKGSWQHPRPLLTRNLALLEAKRLLNLLDHSLLQGGINFLVVAKKGSDSFRATQRELDSLNDVMRRASRSGVIVGDHRLDIEIITPKMDAMLSDERRQLIGRKLANAMLRLPEATAQGAGTEAMKAAMEFLPRIIEADRQRVRRHVENKIYDEIAARNSAVFKFGAPSIWFPKVILSGTQYFTDYIVKGYDRGVISKKTFADAGGFQYEAELQQRTIEGERGDEDVMYPPDIPFSKGNAGDAPDNGTGRPTGGSPDNGRPGATPGNADPGHRAIAEEHARLREQRKRGEHVVAIFDEETQSVVRLGETTRSLLDRHEGAWKVGRMSREERAQLESGKSGTEHGVHMVHVNHGYDTHEEKAVRLPDGATIYYGKRKRDGALVAKAIGFRDTSFTLDEAIAHTRSWGFNIEEIDVSDADQ